MPRRAALTGRAEYIACFDEVQGKLNTGGHNPALVAVAARFIQLHEITAAELQCIGQLATVLAQWAYQLSLAMEEFAVQQQGRANRRRRRRPDAPRRPVANPLGPVFVSGACRCTECS